MKKHKEYLDSIIGSVNEGENKTAKDVESEIGSGYDSDMYKQLAAEDAEIHENDDLYAVFNSIDNVVGAKRMYERIQSINTAVDINKGLVSITATAKKDDAFDSTVFEMFMKDLKEITQTKLTFDHTIDEIALGENAEGGYDKMVLKLTVRR